MKGMIGFSQLSHKLSFILCVGRCFLENTVMSGNSVGLKPETRNHKGFFVQDADYELVSIEASGWALICVDDAVCHYVDPDNLLLSDSEG
jgi:hypothetical protein